MSEVYLNGVFVGEVEQPKAFIDQLKQERRKAKLTQNLNVAYNEPMDSVVIESDKGRVRRPLIVVQNGQPLLTDNHIKQLDRGELNWNDLVEQGIIEYMDAAEEEDTLIAMAEADLTAEHTHLEISALLMLGYCSSLVPYADFAPGARISMGSKNQKQAIGFYVANYFVRMDMDTSILHTPQMPIVKSIIHDISHYEEHPSGQNVTVAIMTYGGYTIEDAIVINRGSIERGMARSTYYRPSTAEELRYPGGLIDEISIPDKDVKGYKSERDYRFLEGDGIIYPEAQVREGDVIIGKTSPPRFLSSMDEYNLASSIRRESSMDVKHGEQGIIDFVLLTENEEGNKLVQVRLRDQRIPEIGDKFTSRHGQKGIVGMIVNSADMPFTASGIVPDLIFSPLGIPSRMTISHLIELIGGKVGALAGRFIDGTTFHGEPEEQLRQQLHTFGFRESGTETMYNGSTGEQFRAKIFVGNMYYLKLRHMVANKIHARARGPIQLLTRQPTEGRAKEGGL